MKARKNLPMLLLLGLLTGAVSACAGLDAVGIGIQVDGPPPAARYEHAGVRPGSGYVWVPGYWDWRGGGVGYTWVSGEWVRPPHARARWERPRWRRHGRDTLYISGHWN